MALAYGTLTTPFGAYQLAKQIQATDRTLYDWKHGSTSWSKLLPGAQVPAPRVPRFYVYGLYANNGRIRVAVVDMRTEQRNEVSSLESWIRLYKKWTNK